MTTHRIRAAREAWHEHLQNCWHCYFFELYAPEHFCPAGIVSYREFIASITANPSCEYITVTDTQKATDA